MIGASSTQSRWCSTPFTSPRRMQGVSRGYSGAVCLAARRRASTNLCSQWWISTGTSSGQSSGISPQSLACSGGPTCCARLKGKSSFENTSRQTSRLRVPSRGRSQQRAIAGGSDLQQDRQRGMSRSCRCQHSWACHVICSCRALERSTYVKYWVISGTTFHESPILRERSRARFTRSLDLSPMAAKTEEERLRRWRSRSVDRAIDGWV